MENEEAVFSFMEMTAATIEDAQRYLAEAGDLTRAIQNYYDSQQSDFPQEVEQPNSIIDDVEEVRPVLPREYSQLVEEESIRSVQLNRVKRQFSSSFRDLKREMEIQENLAKGIAPKRKCLEDIYRNPIDITFNLDLHSAKLMGQKQGKWIALLINDESFPSLSFNRDIFNFDDKVKQLIKKNFVFLRKNSNCDESLRILHNYNLSHQSIPVFIIIDSLTGELKKNFGETKDLTLRQVVKELKKYTTTLDKQLKYTSDVDSDDDILPYPASQFSASTSNFLASQNPTSRFSSQKPHAQGKPTVESESDESFASLSSEENDKSDIEEEPKVLDSDDEALKREPEKQTNIMLKLTDSSTSFKYPSNRTVQQLINYIYRNYLLQTGLYNDGKNRYALISKVHNKCLTLLDQSLNLEQSNIHPSCVLHHNTVEKE